MSGEFALLVALMRHDGVLEQCYRVVRHGASTVGCRNQRRQVLEGPAGRECCMTVRKAPATRIDGAD
jgi:hypothetical protein